MTNRSDLSIMVPVDGSVPAKTFVLEVHTDDPAAYLTEIAGRGEQFFSGSISPDEAAALGLVPANTREGEFGLNYYLQDGLKLVGSYGRQFSSAGNLNLWSVGIAYRFLIPLGRSGAQ